MCNLEFFFSSKKLVLRLENHIEDLKWKLKQITYDSNN